ncbi:MAG: diaminopimelate decarboxylase, partial [Acidobacteriaceae bacterium]|nr:diaminopimelate decarboxylase [Acidobacteriaceae bacterium]
FNVESEAELRLLAARAEALGVRARFALRVNPDVFAETHPYISTGLKDHKFGIDITRARTIYRKAARSKWLDACGVSVHIGSQIRRVDPFEAALKRVVSLVEQLRRDGHNIRYIDAGGGLGIDYGWSAFNPGHQVARYARALAKALGSEQAHLLLEPGRFLVAQAGALIARVLVVKKNGEKNFVVTDAGMNDLIRPVLYHAHHEILPVKQTASKTIIADVVGPICESSDFFARDREIANVKAGDLVAVLDAGAYGMTLASNYNSRPRPAEILVDGGAARIIRRRETMRDLLLTETA